MMDLKKKKEDLIKMKTQMEYAYQKVLGQLELIDEMEKEEKKSADGKK